MPETKVLNRARRLLHLGQNSSNFRIESHHLKQISLKLLSIMSGNGKAFLKKRIRGGLPHYELTMKVTLFNLVISSVGIAVSAEALLHIIKP